MKNFILKYRIEPTLQPLLREKIKHSQLVNQPDIFFRSIARKKLVRIKRYALDYNDFFFLFLKIEAGIKGFNPTDLSNIFDYYGSVKKEYGLTSLDRALDIQGEIYLLSHQDKNKIKSFLEINFLSKKEEVESKEYHLKNWLNDKYISAIKVKGEDRNECYISWYAFDDLSQFSKAYVSSYISNNSFPKVKTKKNRVYKKTRVSKRDRVYYENFLREIFSKMRENQVHDRSEIARYLMYQSVKGVVDLKPHVLKKTSLKKPILNKTLLERRFPSYPGNFCKDLFFWEYCPPEFRTSITKTSQLDLTSWKSTRYDQFLLKQVLNLIKK